MTKNTIGNGVYLVIDPSMDQAVLFPQLEKALQASVSAIQLWDNWAEHIDKDETIRKVIRLGKEYQVPVLANNDWKLLKSHPLDGVHFDEIPSDFNLIKKNLQQHGKRTNLDNVALYGITCNNDMVVVDWATKNGMDYLSFCSMFPSSTSNSCELVSLESVQKARSISDLPIFLAGGIRPDNMAQFSGLDYQGVALVSGIIGSLDPEAAVLHYLKNLNHN